MPRLFLLAILAAVACLSASVDAFASADVIAGASGLASMAPFASVAAAVAAGHLPRGALGRVLANASPAAVIAELQASFNQFKAEHRGELVDFQRAFDALTVRVAGLALTGASNPGAPEFIAPDPTYTRAALDYVRRGHAADDFVAANRSGDRQQIRAAMTTGSPGDGGYVAPVEWDRQILAALRSESPLRGLATVISTGGPGYSTVWSNGAWGSGWVGETASRPNTTTPTLASLVFRTGEIYAQPAVSQQLLEDAAFDFGAWLSADVASEFGRQEAISFISGDGTNKPLGFLSYIGTGTSLHPGGEPGTTVTGSATLVTADGVLSLVYALGAPYRNGAAFLMNSATLAAIRKLKDGQGNYLWQPSYIAGTPQTLVGYPVAIDENMPDIAANAYPIAFGLWRRAYVIVDRLGTTVLRDPFTAKPYVLFYTRKRVGGGIQDPRAIRVLKVAAS